MTGQDRIGVDDVDDIDDKTYTLALASPFHTIVYDYSRYSAPLTSLSLEEWVI